MDFTKYTCPLCKQAFKDTDDVVVCPDCGTPHHRECWLENGECLRADKHGLNEPIEVEFKDVEAEKNTENTENNAQSIAYIGDTNNNFDPENNEMEPPQKIVQDIMDKLEKGEQQEVLIDNQKLSHFAAAIGKNQDYYLPRFMLFEKIKKPLAWNIGGCFFPLAWALYRKMYKLAALIFALYIAVFAISSYPLVANEDYIKASQDCMQEDPQYMVNILMYDTGSGDVTLTANQVKLYEIMKTTEIPMLAIVIIYIITLGIRIGTGFFGTYLYFKKLSRNITKAKEKASVLNMSEDSLKMLLFKKYGTLPIIICAIVGFLEWQMFY